MTEPAERSPHGHSARSEASTVIPREAKHPRSFRAKRSGVAESTGAESSFDSAPGKLCFSISWCAAALRSG
jgi:hypothetical protein